MLLGRQTLIILWDTQGVVRGNCCLPLPSNHMYVDTHLHTHTKILYFFFKNFRILCTWVSYLHACLCITCVPGIHRNQKTMLNLLELELDSYELSCGGWEPNPGLLEKQQVLSTDEPSLQLPRTNLKPKSVPQPPSPCGRFSPQLQEHWLLSIGAKDWGEGLGNAR